MIVNLPKTKKSSLPGRLCVFSFRSRKSYVQMVLLRLVRREKQTLAINDPLTP